MAAAGVGQQWVLVEMVQAFYEVRPGRRPERGGLRVAGGAGSGEVSPELPRERQRWAVLGGESGAGCGSVLRVGMRSLNPVGMCECTTAVY